MARTSVARVTTTRIRRCRRSSCGRPAVATFTYVYADQTAVLGPLATHADPHGYDLCQEHAHTLTAPRGWQVIRLADNFDPPPPTTDDLEALADAVREAARPRRGQAAPGAGAAAGQRHLFAVPPVE